MDAILSQATDLTAAGKTGVAIHAAYDFWTPSRHHQAFHGGLRILTESASAKLATPIMMKFDELDTHPLGYNAQERSWNYLEPWKGGAWRLRDIIDYQQIAFESCLYNAAIHREDMLRNFYKVGRRTTEKTGFYSPGSLLNAKLDLSSPLTRGLPEHIAIWSEQSPAFTSEQENIATYPVSDILLSGWLPGANLIANKSAIVDSKAGEGHIVLFGMRRQYRAQSYQAFKLFFNAPIAYR